MVRNSMLYVIGALLTSSLVYAQTGTDNTVSPLQSYSIPPLTGAYVLPAKAKYNYAEALHKSYLFYHSQKSGLFPYQRLAWRTSSSLTSYGDFGEDLRGGWYEAANSMKWGLPYGFTATTLAFNVYLFKDAFAQVNELAESLEWIKWGADYVVNCHYNDTLIVGQVGVSALGPLSTTIELDVDFNYWGPPEEYDLWVADHVPHIPYYNSPQDPSTEIACEYGATLAAAATVLKPYNPEYAAKLIDHSKRLFTFGTTYMGTYDNSPQEGFMWAKYWYNSSRYTDEIAWNAAWLYAATGDEQYLTLADHWYQISSDSWTEFSWDEKGGGTHILLYHMTKNPFYEGEAVAYFSQFFGANATVPRTPHGLSYVDFWGSVGYAGNIAMLAIAFAKDRGYSDPYSQQLVTYAASQINYALGDYGYSWVVGFGPNYPTRPYHKSSYNSYIDYPLRGYSNDDVQTDFSLSATPQRFILYGAVVGGPYIDDTWHDDRTNYEYSEVTQDYNAAWTGAMAGMVDYYGASNFEPFTDCGLDLGWSHPNASKPPQWPATDCYHTCNKGCPRPEPLSVLLAAAGYVPNVTNTTTGTGNPSGAAATTGNTTGSTAKSSDSTSAYVGAQSTLLLLSIVAVLMLIV